MVSADSGPPQDFAGKTALITGATRGIGLAIAKELAERGARTVITARKPDEIEAAVEEIGAATTIGVRGGADDETHQAEAVSEAIKAFGSLDILVNNAATNPYVGPFIEGLTFRTRSAEETERLVADFRQDFAGRLGDVLPVIAARYGWEQATQAYDDLSSSRYVGKIVLLLPEGAKP
jgi:NAD(P)-dependent dehydrogenase (short-subunit alcohol dehydrogenase family)